MPVHKLIFYYKVHMVTIIHLLVYYHTLARGLTPSSEKISRFEYNNILIYEQLLCTGDLCCRVTRKAVEFIESKRFCELSGIKGRNVESME